MVTATALLLVSLTAPVPRAAAVDGQGVLRWTDDGSEVAVFGVNYYAPCSIDYHQLVAKGLDIRSVIDQDVLHFARLGLTAIRLHVFDREISDREGNLLDNEHLALLDHLVAACWERGIVTVLTPIAWWGVPGESPGFSTFFEMPRMTGDPGEPRAAQRRYLAQFVQHRNRETGHTYAEDPAVLCFELINEPLYPPDLSDADVTEYINALASAVRETGCRKPIFYNAWAGRHAAAANSTIDGVTFGWYPTGLVAGRMLTGDYLGAVNDYPAMRDPQLDGKAKGVYEFDAADVPFPYLYPAMARAFRSGGAQFACQFQYDCWPLAATNCNWQTHYLSLPYTPGKALSFAIAAEAFRRLPRLAEFGSRPGSDRFGPFRVSYPERLAEMVTDREFLYSNDTTTSPPTPAQLERVAGVGSSPVVTYEGTGAYFLDRLAPGVWRLEVYPDAVWVNDPHGPVNPGRETARVIWAERRMRLALPDLAGELTVTPLDPGNTWQPTAQAGEFAVRPGVYLLRRNRAVGGEDVDREYFAPPGDPTLPTVVWHEPPDAWIEGQAGTVTATCTEDDTNITVCYQEAGKWGRVGARRVGAYRFEAALPATALQPGTLRYALVREGPEGPTSYPGARPTWPDQQPDFPPRTLFDARDLREAPAVATHNNPGASAESSLVDGVWRLTTSRFDPTQDSVTGARAPLRAVEGGADLSLRIRARATEPSTTQVEIGFVQADGRAYGIDVPLSPLWEEFECPVERLRPLWRTAGGRLDVAQAKELSVVFGRWLYGPRSDRPHGVEVAAIWVVPARSWFDVPIEPVGPPVPLLRPRVAALQRLHQPGGSLAVVGGPAGPALQIAHTGFGPPPDCLGIHDGIGEQPPARVAALAQCDTLRLTLRGCTPAATKAEIVLTEQDGAPWGAVVELPRDWASVEIPLAGLRYFSWWRQVAGRGGENDRFDPTRIAGWHVTIGAWLNPEHAAEPHIVQVAGIELARAGR